MLTELISNIYSKYKYSFYPKVQEIRGSTRLLAVLEDLSMLNYPCVNEDRSESVFEREWDNLVILDACRHDLYEEVNGSTESRISVASCTPDFIRTTFSEGDFSDVVLVTANPWFSPETLPDIIDRKSPFHTIFHSYQDKWNEEERVVLPEGIVEDVRTAKKLFPDKKLLIHFMQPHQPFIGKEIGSGGHKKAPPELKQDLNNIWTEAEQGIHNSKEIWQAYKHNLEYSMPKVEELVEKLEGKTVITSDHGNLVGEGGLYGHPCGKNYEALRKVPWDVRE